MTAGVTSGIVVPHAPRLGKPEIVPEFGKPLVAGMIEMGRDMVAAAPDVMIVCSAHYISTFNWHASRVARHEGRCVAQEAPDMITGEPYSYRGDPELGAAFKTELEALGLPCIENATPNFTWDYGTWVPVHYMDPDAALAVITVPVVLAADLEETFAAGAAVHRACVATGRTATMVASSSFSHALVRGPAEWPTPERQEADAKFIAMLTEGRLAEARAWFPAYSEFVVGEMQGKVLAWLLGGLIEAGGDNWQGRQYGPYGQSSGSGNANVMLSAAA